MKKLRRSASDRVLFGVCGGLGEYFGVDGDVVRLIWIFLSLLGGVGILPYIAAVLLFPEPAAQAAGEPRMARNIGLVLAGLGGWLLIRQFGLQPLGAGALVWPFRTLLPFVLVAVGLVLVWPKVRELVSPGSRVRRSVSNRVLAGVCGGVAEEAGVDANLLRLGFVTLAVMSTGVAALAYVLLIFVLPEQEVTTEGPASGPPSPPPPESPVESAPEESPSAPSPPEEGVSPERRPSGSVEGPGQAPPGNDR